MVVSYNILINELKKSFSEVGLRNQEKKYFINKKEQEKMVKNLKYINLKV